MLQGSRAAFLPDASLLIRNSGQAAVTTLFNGPVFDLKRLASFWQSNQVSLAEHLQHAVRVESMEVADGQTYTFYVEVSASSDMSSPTTVATETLAAAPGEDFSVNVTRAALLALLSTAAYIRFSCQPNAIAGEGAIDFSSVAQNGDTVTIEDSLGNITVFTYAAAGNGATGAAVNVATGASAADSGNNLLAAINANENLQGITAGGADDAITVSNANGSGGEITKSDADNDYTVTDFADGVAASIAFWAFVKGDHGSFKSNGPGRVLV